MPPSSSSALLTSRPERLGRWRTSWVVITVASLFATGLIALAGTSKSLAADENVAPNLSFVSPGVGPGNTQLNAPYDVAFDLNENLWVANNQVDDQDVVMFDTQQQLLSGDQDVAPEASIEIPEIPQNGGI